jgi:hypothetical protein
MPLFTLEIWIAIIGTIIVGCAVYATVRQTRVPYSLYAIAVCFFAVAAWTQNSGGSANSTAAELEKRLVGLSDQIQDLDQSLKALGVTLGTMNANARLLSPSHPTAKILRLPIRRSTRRYAASIT